jgi:hypothetical protein
VHDRVVRRVGDVQPPELAADSGVVETALPAMLGKRDVALEAEDNPAQPAPTCFCAQA